MRAVVGVAGAAVALWILRRRTCSDERDAMRGRQVRIELLYFDGCPSQARLMKRLRTLLDEARVDDPVDLVRVESLEAAERERFLGSPTVRVGGVDVEPGAERRTDFGLKCRLYSYATGAPDGVPHDDWITAAIARTMR